MSDQPTQQPSLQNQGWEVTPSPPGSGINLSPGAWMGLLEPMLDRQAAAVKQPEEYYNGRQRLAFATAKFREAFSRFFPPLANNWMKLVVDAPVSRLRVQGFRFDADTSKPSWDQQADDDAWAIWQANNLDAGADIAHTEAIKLGVVNLLVSPRADGKEPLISIEHPAQTIVFCNPANRLERLAAMKRWVDFDGYGYLTLYLPDYLHKFRSAGKVQGYGLGAQQIQWVRRRDDPVDGNPAGVVPMIPLENNPDLMWGGRSDLEVAMPIQDAINKFCLDMQVSAEFHAFPQRWAAGWEKAVNPDGSPVDPSLAMGSSRLVTAASTDTTFGSFTQGDVTNYLSPIEMYVDHLAAVTQTPAYYLKGKMANLSADALHAADAGLVDRCGRKIRSFSDGWEETMRVAFLMKGDSSRGTAKSAETLWADPETKSLAQVVDAAVKMRQNLSVPLEMCWALLGWTPQQIKQAKAHMNLPDSPPPGGTPNTGPMPPGPGGAVLLPPAQPVPAGHPYGA